MTVRSEEIGEDTLPDQQLSHNSCRHQEKIDTECTKIATVRSELHNTLEENQILKNMFNPDQLVEAMTKVVSMMTMKKSLKTLQDIQYKSASHYVGKQTAPVGT